STLTFRFTAGIPDPKQTKMKMFRRRRAGKNKDNRAQYSRSTNPQRTDARTRQRRNDNYEFELAQYDYHNRPKRVVRKIWDSSADNQAAPTRCEIPMQQLEDHFDSVLSAPNNHVLDNYPPRLPREDVSISVEQVNEAIMSTKKDTSPGFDRILARTIRDLGVGNIIKTIIDIMLATGNVPTKLSDGKT